MPPSTSYGIPQVETSCYSDSESDDDIDHILLPSGQAVCSRHHLVTCHICCVDFDFSFMGGDFGGKSEGNSKAKESGPFARSRNANADSSQIITEADLKEMMEMLGPPQKKRGTGRVFPTEFVPSPRDTAPFDLFHGISTYNHFARYVHHQDRTKALIFTDGACLNNGQVNAQAGWAMVAGPPELRSSHSCGILNGRLEKKGPFGNAGEQTSNRAELRAVLAALTLRHWPGEGFETLIIATDSQYVVQGATTWVKSWMRRDWTTAKGYPVKNKDMWEMLLGEVEQLADDGLQVQFWWIERELNHVADLLAKEGANKKLPDDYEDVLGI